MRKIILSLLLVSAVVAAAQQTITGTVTDSRGDAMAMVSLGTGLFKGNLQVLVGS